MRSATARARKRARRTNLGNLILQTGNYLLSNAVNRMLTGAGLTLATASVSTVVINGLINDLQQNLQGLSALGLAIIDLSGTDVAISLIVSAIMSRIAIQNAQIFLAKADT